MRAGNTLVAGADRALYRGALAATGWHAHAAPVLLLGLSGPFALELAGGRGSCRSALVDEGFDLGALLAFRWPDAPPVDARIQRSLALLRAPALGPTGREAASAAAQLSASRFNHLFRAEMGVSFRSYRLWSQLRSAMLAVDPGRNLTEAALEGAFADAAHFSRIFRQSFGMTPSSVLKPLVQVRRL